MGWPAPAKINRFLHITGQRADGYHTLQTVFQFIEPHDQLAFRVTGEPLIRRHGGLPGLAAEDDLVVQAASALQQAGDVGQGVEIQLDKRIPAGAGLGGGSSDAATTLVALNKLWGCGLQADQLQSLALALGADVPVFVAGQAAWAEGVGDQLTPIEPDCPWLVVVNPQVSVDTGKVFHHPKLTRNSRHITIRAFTAGSVGNDCEPLVRTLYPVVGEALEALGAYAPASLTGTGGCIFARFVSQQAAEAVRQKLPQQWQSWVCRANNRSALIERLDAEKGTDNWGVAKR